MKYNKNKEYTYDDYEEIEQEQYEKEKMNDYSKEWYNNFKEVSKIEQAELETYNGKLFRCTTAENIEDEVKGERIKRKYKNRKNTMLLVEKAFKDGNYSKVVMLLQDYIKDKAFYWCKDNNYSLSLDVLEVESRFYGVLYKLLYNNHNFNDELTFMEHFEHMCKLAFIDYFRYIYKKKRKRHYQYVPLNNDKDREKIFAGKCDLFFNPVEVEIIKSDTISDIYKRMNFTDEEMLILKELHINPDLSYSEICKVTGIKYPSTVQRQLDKIRLKLSNCGYDVVYSAGSRNK